MLWMSDVRYFLKEIFNIQCITFISYTCNKLEEYKDATLLMWNTSVSDNCCKNCNGVVYRADSVLETIHHKDECQTKETSVCKFLPGKRFSHFPLKMFLSKGYDKAKAETKFSYKNCCNDATGKCLI